MEQDLKIIKAWYLNPPEDGITRPFQDLNEMTKSGEFSIGEEVNDAMLADLNEGAHVPLVPGFNVFWAANEEDNLVFPFLVLIQDMAPMPELPQISDTGQQLDC